LAANGSQGSRTHAGPLTEDGDGGAWRFHFLDGHPHLGLGETLAEGSYGPMSACGVHPGDVGVVPEPSSLPLIGLEMLGLVWTWRSSRWG
jgi:hypothetical protein